MEKRLARGDKGINPLDAACREHDIAYANHKDSEERHKADLQLKAEANKRIFARDSGLGERAAAAAVSAAMGVKTTLGAGFRKMKRKTPKRKTKKSKDISFKQLISGVKKGVLNAKPKTYNCAVKAAIRVARKLRSGKQITKLPRVIKVPSISGGILPIIPILSGLAAAGTITNTVMGIINAIKSIRNRTNGGNAQQGAQKIGAGLYLSPQSRGSGLYLKPYQGNGLYLKPYVGKALNLKPFSKN